MFSDVFTMFTDRKLGVLLINGVSGVLSVWQIGTSWLFFMPTNPLQIPQKLLATLLFSSNLSPRGGSGYSLEAVEPHP